MDFIEANGVGLRCELSGGGDRTLVLVHEMGGSLESWATSRQGSRNRAACCAMTPAALDCRKRCAAS